MPDYFVRPYDVLFFRGNKSFYFVEWYSEGVFPPYPSTFQGFVRNKILFDSNLIDATGKLRSVADTEKEVGNDSDLNLKITGPYLIDAETKVPYFKTPADIFKKDEKVNCWHSLLRGIKRGLETDLNFPLSITEHPKEKLDSLCPPEFVSLEGLRQYRMSLDNITIEDKGLFINEDRVVIGFKREKENRSVQDKRFCVTQYKRLRDSIGFYCSVDREIDNGALKLGSESHPVYFQKIQDDNLIEKGLKDSRDELIDAILETKTFRIALLQPGVFKNGWFPFDCNDNKSCAIVDGLDLKLLFAFTGNPINISGYSFVNSNKSGDQSKISLKRIVKAVPSGSVYLFRIKNGCTKEMIQKFVNRYDNNKIEYIPYNKMGFNHIILAKGPELKEV
jgi:CRISPR type III-B/RAMP module-associated protein Cmr3